MNLVINVQTMKFADNGHIPNNPDLPLVLYQDALPDEKDLVTVCRRLFNQHGWSGIWVDSVFDYHHYHSTAHEAMAVTLGWADIQFGGENGEVVTLRTGDVVLIPAGVSHCKLAASPDFQVIAAYPPGQNWDLCIGEASERPQVLQNIKSVPLPPNDPIYGDTGFLPDAWKNAT
jgi:uncharacterized protein YjlB